MNNNNQITKKEPNTMHILVTNDNGVTAPGCCPGGRNEQPGQGQHPGARPQLVGFRACQDPGPTSAHEGSAPERADHCLGQRWRPFGLRGAGDVRLPHEKIDLVVSGINPYANLGHDVTYSGTVTAAMEAAIGGSGDCRLAGIARNLARSGGLPRRGAIARVVAQSVLRYGLAPNVLLNVNVPYLPYDIEGHPHHPPGAARLP